jgi:ribosomal protein S18 acetylase RimI-like enzyme
VIVPFRQEHVIDVARLHCATLTGLLSELGITAAEAFYSGCARSALPTAMVCANNGLLQGFVLGSVHPGKLTCEVLRQNPAGVLASLGLGILRRPSSLRSLLQGFRGPDEGSYDRGMPELTYLAVAIDQRASGIGRQLVEAFTEHMRNAGVEAYELSVDEDNKAAISFYERLGFVLSGRYQQFGLPHLRYRLETSAPTAD